MKLIKDGIVNSIGFGLGYLVIVCFHASLAGLIVELVMTLIARVMLETKLKTNSNERDHNIWCDICGFSIANVAILVGSLLHFMFPFMGAAVAMLLTERVVKLIK